MRPRCSLACLVASTPATYRSCHTSAKYSNPIPACLFLVLSKHSITSQSSSRGIPVVRSLTCRSRDRSVLVAERRLLCPSAPLQPFCWRNERAYWRGARSDSAPALKRARARDHMLMPKEFGACQGAYTRTEQAMRSSRKQASLHRTFLSCIWQPIVG